MKIKNNIELFAGIAAGLIFVLVLIPYIKNFGTTWSSDNDVWGQFGDYLGGSLNPVFGLLTLLVLLYNTRMQQREIKKNSRLMAKQTKMLNKQVGLTKQRAIEDFAFQLLEEARTDEYVQAALKAEGNIVAGIFILSLNADGEYDASIKSSEANVEMAGAYFHQHVGVELGALMHVIYPKLLALTSCAIKLPKQNRNFIATLIKTRFGIDVVSAVIHMALFYERNDDYEEFKKLPGLLHGISDRLVFSDKVFHDFCYWLDEDTIEKRVSETCVLLTETINKKRTPVEPEK